MKQSIKLKDVAELIGGELNGDPELEINGIRDIENAGKGELTFLANRKYLPLLEQTKASAVICPSDIELPGMDQIRMKNPYLGFAKIMQHFFPRKRDEMGVHEKAYTAPSARIGEGTNIYPGASVGENARIGKNCDILPGCSIGKGAVIGDNCLLYPNVTVYHQCEVGNRCIIHAGTVIGSDGFGFATDEKGEHHKIPQIGNVIIEDDVEIGSNSSIDRAVLGSTRIGEGTKVDNLIQIAHNVQIGKRCFIVAQVGISGSSKVGNDSILAGQVGVVGHIRIGNKCIIAAQSGVLNDVPDGEMYLGSPARPMAESKKIMVTEGKLPEMRHTLKSLIKRVEELEAKIS